MCGIRSFFAEWSEEKDMKYVLLVSHGTLAPALHDTLVSMFVGTRDDFLYANESEGMGADDFVEILKEKLKVIGEDDEIIVLGDILGGSPITYASYAINLMGFIDRAVFMTGMNMGTVIDVLFSKDSMSIHELVDYICNAPVGRVMPFTLSPYVEEDTETI